MGYLLPINPIQSQQYANRMSMKPYNFVTVNRVQRVNLKSDFHREFEESLDSRYEKNRENKEQSNQMPSQSEYNPYIFPNPINLSPAISQIVGKGITVNTYI